MACTGNISLFVANFKYGEAQGHMTRRTAPLVQFMCPPCLCLIAYDVYKHATLIIAPALGT